MRYRQAFRKYVWSGWPLLTELDPNNNVVRKYTWGLDLAEPSGQIHSLGGAGGATTIRSCGVRPAVAVQHEAV